LIDQETGEDLGSTEEEVGSVKVNQILKKIPKADVVSGGSKIKKGYFVRLKTEQEQQTTTTRELTPGSSDKPFKW